MGKSIKQKLREAEKQNHEAFRKQLLEDISSKLDNWSQQVEQLMNHKSREYNRVFEKMEKVNGEVVEVSKQLRKISFTTTGEIKKLKQGRTWKFYLNTALTTILSSFFTILVCAAYWPEIRSLFG